MEKKALNQLAGNWKGPQAEKSVLERYCQARLRAPPTDGLPGTEEEREGAEAWLALVSRAESMARLGVGREDTVLELRSEAMALGSEMLHGRNLDSARDVDAIRRLAGARDANSKYPHAIALRHLVGLPPGDPRRAVYAEASAEDTSLADVSGHPWELSAFFRALLETAPAKRTAMLRHGYELAKDGGPTLKAISLVIGAGLLPSGDLSSEVYLAALDEVFAQLPAIGEARLAAPRAQPQAPVPLLELAKIVLPFNFR